MRTEGKWTAKKYPNGDPYRWIVSWGGVTVANLDGQGCTIPEAKDNARLIAAAPDLLAFVKQWSGHHHNCDCLDEGSPRTDCTCGYDGARDEAIALAE